MDFQQVFQIIPLQVVGKQHLQMLYKPEFWLGEGAQFPNPTQVSILGGARRCGEGGPQCWRGCGQLPWLQGLEGPSAPVPRTLLERAFTALWGVTPARGGPDCSGRFGSTGYLLGGAQA